MGAGRGGKVRMVRAETGWHKLGGKYETDRTRGTGPDQGPEHKADRSLERTMADNIPGPKNKRWTVRRR